MTDKEGPVNLCGNGRSDSPGHNAKYGTYSLMDEASGNIIDFSLVQVSEVSSSNAIENEGCQSYQPKCKDQIICNRSLHDNNCEKNIHLLSISMMFGTCQSGLLKS